MLSKTKLNTFLWNIAATGAEITQLHLLKYVLIFKDLEIMEENSGVEGGAVGEIVEERQK